MPKDTETLEDKHDEDLRDVRGHLAGHDKRIAVLEARMVTTDERIDAVQTELRDLRGDLKDQGRNITNGIDYVARTLRNHVDKENKDREALMRSALWALLSAGGTLVMLVGGWAAPRLLALLHP